MAWVLRSRVTVVHLDETGYRVAMVRGAGVKEARWSDVEDAVTASPAGFPCVVIRLRDGGTTTIPVQALAADPDDFARDVRDRLRAGRTTEPLIRRRPIRSSAAPPCSLSEPSARTAWRRRLVRSMAPAC